MAMRQIETSPRRPGRFAWLFELPPRSERTMRMEALIARLRLLVLAINGLALAVLLDTTGWHTDAAWWIVSISVLYAIPTALLQPYRRWRVFETSMLTAALDSAGIAAFIAFTGAHESPFFLLYFLSVAAVAMRFDLRQAIAMCAVYAFSYACVYFATWESGANGIGELALRLSYMFFIAVGVGHLAREENYRARQIDEIERLHAENQRLHSRQERAARLDRLTAMLNRANFEKDAQREIRKTRAAGGYLSVLFCDMDHLKRINDELGHDSGDRVLRAVGASMKRCLRSNDLIGRYGGDEFVIVLPNVTRETAFERGEQLIDAVRGVNEGLPEDLHVGLSVGIATYPFDAQDYSTLVRVADQAMYLAKREGGNRARTSNDLRLFWEDIPYTA
jgi:diguanylate cyclase (GGDEF)-like protein